MKNEVNHNSRGASSRVVGPFSALLLVNFTGAMGFSIVLPFMVFLVHQWGGNAIIFGLASAMYSIFQLFGSTFLGRWSDYLGRKRMLAMSQMGTVMAWMIVLVAFYIPAKAMLKVDSHLLGKFSLTLPLILLFVSRALDGLTGGNAWEIWEDGGRIQSGLDDRTGSCWHSKWDYPGLRTARAGYDGNLAALDDYNNCAPAEPETMRPRFEPACRQRSKCHGKGTSSVHPAQASR
jgi:MFS family permease